MSSFSDIDAYSTHATVLNLVHSESMCRPTTAQENMEAWKYIVSSYLDSDHSQLQV